MLKAIIEKIEKIFASAVPVVSVAALGILFLLKPQQTAMGVAEGLQLSAVAVIPSLFPFLALSSFAVNSGAAETVGRLLSTPVKLLFRLPGCAAAVIIMGLFGGYPVGAAMTAKLYSAGSLTENEAQRLLAFCVNGGPAFVISAVGATMLSSSKAGVILFASLCLSSLTSGFLLRFLAKRQSAIEEIPTLTSQPLTQSLAVAAAEGASASVSIAAWVALFRCFSSLLEGTQLSENALLSLQCLLEVTSGCAASEGKINLPAVAAVLGWAGLSVHCQLLSSVRTCGMKPLVFMTSRAVSGGFSAIFCRILLSIFPTEIKVFSTLASPALSAGLSFSAPSAAFLLIMCAMLIASVPGQKDVAFEKKI